MCPYCYLGKITFPHAHTCSFLTFQPLLLCPFLWEYPRAPCLEQDSAEALRPRTLCPVPAFLFIRTLLCHAICDLTTSFQPLPTRSLSPKTTAYALSPVPRTFP